MPPQSSQGVHSVFRSFMRKPAVEATGTPVYTARNRETGEKITAASLPVLEGHLIAAGEPGSR